MVGQPKTASGEDRRVDFDAATAGSLIAHRLQQDVERAAFSAAYEDHDLVFAREDGSYLKPEVVSKTFHALVAEAGLRRVRPHDLRHGQASIMLAAGVDMTVVSKRLGHSGIRITSDTYTHLLDGVGRTAAALLVLAAGASAVASGQSPHGFELVRVRPVGGVRGAALAVYWVANLVFFVFGEEIGWRGFLQPQLERRYSTVLAANYVAIVWAAWHLPLFGITPSYRAMPAIGFVGFAASISIWFGARRRRVRWRCGPRT